MNASSQTKRRYTMCAIASAHTSTTPSATETASSGVRDRADGARGGGLGPRARDERVGEADERGDTRAILA
jgi:hypothetical protein